MSEVSFAWNSVQWPRVIGRICRLQRRIYKARLVGPRKRVHWLQNKLIHSFDAKLLAVHLVTNKKRSPILSGKKQRSLLSGNDKLFLAQNLSIDGKAFPTSQVFCPPWASYIDAAPQVSAEYNAFNSGYGKHQKGVLCPSGTFKEVSEASISAICDRAKQVLALLALEPEWEAIFEPNSFGFRPGRCVQDAIETIFLTLHQRTLKHVLSADIRECFHKIDHNLLLLKLDTFKLMENQLSAWLKSGVMSELANNDQQSYIASTQGGGISSLLANIVLHGVENHLTKFVDDLSFRAFSLVRQCQPHLPYHTWSCFYPTFQPITVNPVQSQRVMLPLIPRRGKGYILRKPSNGSNLKELSLVNVHRVNSEHIERSSIQKPICLGDTRYFAQCSVPSGHLKGHSKGYTSSTFFNFYASRCPEGGEKGCCEQTKPSPPLRGNGKHHRKGLKEVPRLSSLSQGLGMQPAFARVQGASTFTPSEYKPQCASFDLRRSDAVDTSSCEAAKGVYVYPKGMLTSYRPERTGRSVDAKLTSYRPEGAEKGHKKGYLRLCPSKKKDCLLEEAVPFTIVRFAGELVIFHAQQLILDLCVAELQKWLGNSGLEIAKKNCSIKDCRQSFTFLGFNIIQVQRKGIARQSRRFNKKDIKYGRNVEHNSMFRPNPFKFVLPEQPGVSPIDASSCEALMRSNRRGRKGVYAKPTSYRPFGCPEGTKYGAGRSVDAKLTSYRPEGAEKGQKKGYLLYPEGVEGRWAKASLTPSGYNKLIYQGGRGFIQSCEAYESEYKVKAKITPSREACFAYLDKVRDIIKKNRQVSTYNLIFKLRPVTIDWANYYRFCDCSVIFRKMENLVFQMLRHWVFRRHSRENRFSIKEKYWPSGRTYQFDQVDHQNNWVLCGKSYTQGGILTENYLPHMSWFENRKFVKIQEKKSFYDSDFLYWAERRSNKSKLKNLICPELFKKDCVLCNYYLDTLIQPH